MVEIVGDDTLILMRKPKNWTEHCAGKMGDVLGDHADILAYLEAERWSWEGPAVPNEE